MRNQFHFKPSITTIKEQKLFEETAEDIKTKLETSYQTHESLKNAATTLNLIRRAEDFFHQSPCNVSQLKAAEETKKEFGHMKKLLDKTEKVMDDFEMYQKGESLEDPEVINRRQDVHSAWSRLQWGCHNKLHYLWKLIFWIQFVTPSSYLWKNVKP